MSDSEEPRSLELSHRMAPDTNPVALRRAMLRRVDTYLHVSHQVVFLAIPSCAEHYADILSSHFAAIGRDFDEGEIDLLRQHLAAEIDEAYAVSPYGKIRVTFETEAPPSQGVRYQIEALPSSLEDQYRSWVETRAPPLFGAHPDRFVMEVAASLGPPESAPVLDVGAGTGRNTLALARRGHPVDALELSADLADALDAEIAGAGLGVRVLRADVLAKDTLLAENRYALTVVSEVVSHLRGEAPLRVLLERLAAAAAPGGRVVLNVFVCSPTYAPSRMAVEVSQATWSSLYTYAELHAALEGLPLELVADELVYDYEKARTPLSEWPPTGWYEQWSLGLDIFALDRRSSPVELHWLVLRKRAAAET